MHIRPATAEEIVAFYAELMTARGAESDHQDEYVAATALDTSKGIVVGATGYESGTDHYHVADADVEDPLFFINFRSHLS